MMNQKIKVSIDCLAYNHEKYIRDALEGFVSQITDFKYEVFVHDDASTDGTAKIIAEYAEKYPEIIKPIYQKENQYSKGVNISREILFPLFSGEYVAICEGDDYWTSPNKLQKQANFLDQHLDYSACAHNSEVLYCDTGEKDLRNLSKEEYDVGINEVIASLRSERREPWQLSGLMYRRNVNENEPEFVGKLKAAGDITLDLNLLTKGKVRFMPKVMSVYRYGTKSSKERQKSKRHDKIDQELINMLESFDAYTDYKYHEEICKSILKRQFMICMGQGDYTRLRKGDFLPLYKELPFKTRMKITIKKFFS